MQAPWHRCQGGKECCSFLFLVSAIYIFRVLLFFFCFLSLFSFETKTKNQTKNFVVYVCVLFRSFNFFPALKIWEARVVNPTNRTDGDAGPWPETFRPRATYSSKYSNLQRSHQNQYFYGSLISAQSFNHRLVLFKLILLTYFLSILLLSLLCKQMITFTFTGLHSILCLLFLCPRFCFFYSCFSKERKTARQPPTHSSQRGAHPKVGLEVQNGSGFLVVNGRTVQ